MPFRQLRLTQEALPERLVLRQLRRKQLQRHPPIEALVVGQVDHRHAAADRAIARSGTPQARFRYEDQPRPIGSCRERTTCPRPAQPPDPATTPTCALPLERHRAHHREHRPGGGDPGLPARAAEFAVSVRHAGQTTASDDVHTARSEVGLSSAPITAQVSTIHRTLATRPRPTTGCGLSGRLRGLGEPIHPLLSHARMSRSEPGAFKPGAS